MHHYKLHTETEDGKTWLDIFKQYEPDISEEKATYILWNETCFPFNNDITIKQIKEYFENLKK